MLHRQVRHGVPQRQPPASTARAAARTPSTACSCARSRKPRDTTACSRSQFRGYYELAERRPGQAGQNLLAILESRLDNVIYRLGFAMSRAEARQLVTHGHFTVNGRKVNIPSYLVKPGMVITLKDSSRSLEKIKSSVEANAFRQPPKWLEYDANNMVAKVVGVPEREDIDLPIEEHLIVELYSK